MAAPPLEEGAVQETATCPLAPVAVTAVGAPGTEAVERLELKVTAVAPDFWVW